jgi:hypothetical protein
MRGTYSDMARRGSTNSFTPPVVVSQSEPESTKTEKSEPAKSFLEDYLDKNKEEVAGALKTAGIGMVYKGDEV